VPKPKSVYRLVERLAGEAVALRATASV
jgi:hypothetical protein